MAWTRTGLSHAVSMKVLAQKFCGSIHICDNCNAVLAYKPSDIYEGTFIYCPVCKMRQRCAMDLRLSEVVNGSSTSNSKK